jgi:hypothetical protein
LANALRLKNARQYNSLRRRVHRRAKGEGMHIEAGVGEAVGQLHTDNNAPVVLGQKAVGMIEQKVAELPHIGRSVARPVRRTGACRLLQVASVKYV